MAICRKQGSATSATPSGDIGVVIAHICNSKGGWGRGFVLAVDQLSPVPQSAYRALAKQYKGNIPLGTLQFVEAQPNIFVANMVAQDGYADDHADGCAVNYDSLRKCLETVFKRARRLGYSVHLPEGMGSGLAGGDKSVIHKMIDELLVGAHLQTPYVGASLDITLWEFTDKTAVSYVAPVTPSIPGSPITTD